MTPIEIRQATLDRILEKMVRDGDRDEDLDLSPDSNLDGESDEDWELSLERNASRHLEDL
ncbi:hypothetical protein MKW92_052938, partial [Papaver armeniacum]